MKHALAMKLMMMLLLAGCANTTPAHPERSRGTAEPETTVRLQSPIRVTWEEVSRTDTSAVVLAKIERLNRLDMPFVMTVELPAGVKALEGRTQLTLLPNAEPVLVTERLTLAYEALPAGDALLELDGDSGAMGFHYKVPYRFGRPAPEEKGPDATGPAPMKGGKSFGPSIPLK